ncbi:uroporphyrinogen-III synthase [Xanthomonadaceae bacterium XH05]|nr:uroporphyrinogen-III synthase [Xanthomonadaceae bacterium XH05]
MNRSPDTRPLAGWSVLCLRPSMQQAAARRAAQARGARHVALPGVRLVSLPAAAALEQALACATLVFTSPAAVHFAARQRPLRPNSATQVFAVGAGTARALARQGIEAIAPPPEAMHSEGMLAMPQWQGVIGAVGLVTAPGGRGVIAAGLNQRGLRILRAEVYQRLPPQLDARHHHAIRSAVAPRAVLVSSAEALDGALAALPPALRAHVLESLAVASSPRLANHAEALGFARVFIASAPTTSAMLDALESSASPGFR